MHSDSLSRRALLSAVGSVATARALAADAGAGNSGQFLYGAPDGGFLPVPLDVLAAAEKVAGVQYTPREREQVSRTLADQLDSVKRRREYVPANAALPAHRFDPRLPQTKLPARDVFRPSAPPRVPVPSSDEDLAYASVAQLSSWLRARRLTSERLTRVYLDRLTRHGAALRCVATLTPELALAQARQADAELAKGKWRGPLHGVPYGAKDLLDTAGITTAWGSAAYRDRVPDRDATVIIRLREAGAVLVAKLSLGDLAYGDLWYGGRTANPWYPEEGASGSSAGPAAATAAGLVGFSIGSETLGSIISPSMRCGVTGLRPTFGRVPRGGAMTLCWSMDKLGPMCRTVEDTALVLRALCGADVADPCSVTVPLDYDAAKGVAGLTVGYSPAWFEAPSGNEVDRAALRALERTGVKLVPVELPALPYSALYLTLLAESAAAFEELTLSGRDELLSLQDDDAFPNGFRTARFISAVDLIQADRLRRVALERYHQLFSTVDALFSPSYASRLLSATNYTGHPSLTLRAGFFELGAPRLETQGPPVMGPKRQVPHGVTLWGRLYDEGTLLRLGTALERALDVWHRRPPV